MTRIWPRCERPRRRSVVDDKGRLSADLDRGDGDDRDEGPELVGHLDLGEALACVHAIGPRRCDVQVGGAADHADRVVTNDVLDPFAARVRRTGTGRGDALAAVDDRVARPLAGGVVDDLHVVHVAPEVDDREHEEQEDRDDERELDEGLAARSPLRPTAHHGVRSCMRNRLSRASATVSGSPGNDRIMSKS